MHTYRRSLKKDRFALRYIFVGRGIQRIRRELTGGRSIRVSGAVDPSRPRQLLSRIGYRWSGRVGGRIGGGNGRGVGRRASFRAAFLGGLGGRL